jgi:hypothetical protein
MDNGLVVGCVRPSGGTAVHTLIGHRNVPVALRCLPSLPAYSVNPIRLIIHDDGTLTQVDFELLLAALPGCSFITRTEADERVQPALARFPASLRFRQQNPFALKLLDLYYCDQREEISYCDSDVLFFHPFRDLFFLPSPEVGTLTMHDNRESYSLRSWQLARHRRIRLASRVNAGMLVLRRASYDPELVEWFLSLRDLNVHPQWKEQTCWSMLAYHSGAWQWNSCHVKVITAIRDLQPDLIAGHFVTPYRQLIPQESAKHSLKDVVRVNTIPAGDCGPLRLLRDDIGRIAGRMVRRWQPK